MRYFSYHEYYENPNTNTVVTMSEEEIREGYYDWWYEKMCKKFGKERVDENYSFEECLEDWKITHYAWEVNDD